MNSKVSIIIPCYNQELYLEDTLNSVFSQTFDNWECLIVDDGSIDSSAEIANKWCERDERFKLLKKANGGLSSARNYGLDHAVGEYIQFLDGDDLLYPEKLKQSLNFGPEHDIIITSFEHVRKANHLPPFCELKKEYFSYNAILLQWDGAFSIPIHCGLFKSKLLARFRFDEEVKAGEDWLFWLAMYRQGPSTYFLDKTLVCYRLHEKSMTQDNSHMITNKHIAHLKIYSSLTEDNKQLFFERFSSEALQLRATLMDIHKRHEHRRERKLSRRIKKFFKSIF